VSLCVQCERVHHSSSLAFRLFRNKFSEVPISQAVSHHILPTMRPLARMSCHPSFYYFCSADYTRVEEALGAHSIVVPLLMFRDLGDPPNHDEAFSIHHIVLRPRCVPNPDL